MAIIRIDTNKVRKLVLRALVVYTVHKLFIRRWLDRRPQLIYKEGSSVARLIRDRCSSTLSHYIPTFYLFSGVLQTISGESRGSEAKVAKQLVLKRDVINVPRTVRPPGMWCCPNVIPNGIISVDWMSLQGYDNPPADAPVVILVPGLTGDSNATYVQTVASYLYRNGVRTVCFNPRGRGDNAVDNPLLYSAGFTQDLRVAVQYIRSNVGANVSLFAVGFSLGSNYLAKYVGEEGDDCILQGAVCCASPSDCLTMSNYLNNSMLGRLMDPFLVSLVQKMRSEMEHVLHLHPKIDVSIVREAKTMAEFDHSLIAPMFGFDCVSDYYRYASCSMHLWRIRTPTLFVNAWNDPIVPGKYVRMDNFKVNPFLMECMTQEGGHSMIWPTGIARDSWVARVIVEFAFALNSKQGSEVISKERIRAKQEKPIPSIVPAGYTEDIQQKQQPA